jgi:hypothetical protein
VYAVNLSRTAHFYQYVCSVIIWKLCLTLPAELLLLVQFNCTSYVQTWKVIKECRLDGAGIHLERDVIRRLLSVQTHLSLTLHAIEISNCSDGQCIWDWCFSLTTRAIKQVPASQPAPTFPSFSPLPHPTNFKIWKMDHTPQFFLNPLNAELNSICHLLALLGAHPILHVSRIRVKNLSCPTIPS